ncbi:YbaK/EbsC family protein [Haloparvum sp. PAK95]|uniref:YbaK/EbsC family protein n=1 Tax=Haloparvum sp. PAK95 TaxID=3418962 RepID=UPI003D2EE669
MHERAAEFVDRAVARYDVAVDVTEFPEGTKTAAEAADAVDCDVAQIASSIVIGLSGTGPTSTADDGPPADLVVAVTSGANRVDLDAVADYFDASSASMADADRIREVVGWSIGGVPPICHETALPTVLDPTLTEYDTVWAAAGTPSAMWSVAPERLRELADSTVVDLTE